jgi:hypothetical protein
MADGLREIWRFGGARFQNATAKNVVLWSLDIFACYVHLGNGKLDFGRIPKDSIADSLHLDQFVVI